MKLFDTECKTSDLRLSPEERQSLIPQGKRALFIVNKRQTICHVIFNGEPDILIRLSLGKGSKLPLKVIHQYALNRLEISL